MLPLIKLVAISAQNILACYLHLLSTENATDLHQHCSKRLRTEIDCTLADCTQDWFYNCSAVPWLVYFAMQGDSKIVPKYQNIL